MKELFIAVDGDDVGHRLEYFMLINDQLSLSTFTATFSGSMSWLEERLRSDLDARIVFIGGDNLLAILLDNGLVNFQETLEKIRLGFSEKAISTLSIGVGRSPREAYLALKLAKASGKNCIRRYEELPNG